MDKKMLKQLRDRAEESLREISREILGEIPLPINKSNIEELIHELEVYHVELEIQLEDLKKAHHEIEISQQRYMRLFDFAPIGYIETDTNGNIINANSTISTMLDVPKISLRKLQLAKFILSDFQDIYHLNRRRVLRTRQPQDCIIQMQKVDGTIFHVQLNMDVMEASIDTADDIGETLRIAITDITKIKRAEETLIKTLNQEKELNQLRTRLLSMISHEFRTPLSIMLTSINILERYNEKLTEEKKQERYETIRNAVWHINNIVDETVNIQQVTQTLPHLNLQPFDLLLFMKHLINDINSMQQDDRQIIAQIDCNQDTEQVTWDENMLRHIVMSLIDNALKYSEGTIIYGLKCTDDAIQLWVKDQGKGISEEDQKYMYDAFYRGKNSEFIHGTGIGLFVVQQAVHAHGGKIRCESQPEKGTTFIIDLPRHVANVK